jgi:hypothetical protein
MSNSQADLDERVKIFEEIKDTERRYLQSLDLLTKTYLQPIQQRKIGPQGKEFKNLISTLSMIVNFNDFLNKMLHKTTADNVGKIFQQVIPFLKTYREYFNNYEKAQSDIRQQKKDNRKFAEWLDRTEREMKAKNLLTMNQYLIMPIQRIPRYNLLLRELIKHTPEDHPDYKELNDALSKSAEVSDFLNEQIKEMENSQKLLHLSKIIVVNQNQKDTLVIVLPHRKFVFEGALDICNDTDPKKLAQERYFFLFSDMLLCCTRVTNEQLGFIQKLQQEQKKKRKGSKREIYEDEESKIKPEYFIQKPIHFFNAKARDAGEITQIPFVRSFDDFCPPFKRDTIFQLITTKDTYTFQCKTAEERAQWVSYFQKVIDELVRIHSKHAQDKALPKCYPAILREEAALFVQKIYRGNIARKEHEKEFAKMDKKLSPHVQQQDIKSIVSTETTDYVEHTHISEEKEQILHEQEKEKKKRNEELREIERKRHEETELYKAQLEEESRKKAEAERERKRVEEELRRQQQEERKKREEEEEERKRLEEEEEEKKRLAEEAERIRKQQEEEEQRLAEEERRRVEEMEEIERVREATRIEEERIKKEQEHLQAMHLLEQQQKQREAEEAKKRSEAMFKAVSPRVQPPQQQEMDNLSPWQREIMNRYKKKEKQNFVAVKEIDSLGHKKQTSSHAEELSKLVDNSRKGGVSHLLQRFEQVAHEKNVANNPRTSFAKKPLEPNNK